MSCDEFMCIEEDYGLEYSKERNSDLDAHLEYQYYKSKALKYNDPEAALLSFQEVLDLEEGEKGEWGFKALKQMIKINLKLMSNDEVLSRFKQLLTYTKSAITRYYSEKSIESILDYISTNKNKALLKNIYEKTLGALEDTKNDRLWFKTNIQLGKLYLDLGDFDKLATILKLLFNSCIAVDDIQVQATELLEISALGIQRCAARRDSDKLKYLYELSINVESAFPCPLLMGYIRQCGGEMHFLEDNFEMAYTDFFEAFKYYNKSGSPLRINCLIYILLTNMFEISEINIFDSQEAKPYTKHPKILAMTNLVMSIQNHNINERENIWKKIKNIMDDPFIAFILLKYISNIL